MRLKPNSEAQKKNPMSKVFRWRLMAEEIRTEADGFSSTSAKHTLLYAAQTLDRMAKDMERWFEKINPRCNTGQLQTRTIIIELPPAADLSFERPRCRMARPTQLRSVELQIRSGTGI
jgi:hypothetical protein